MDLQISRAKPEDIPDLASLRGGGPDLEARMLGYLLGSYSPSFALADREVLVAKVENRFAGYVAGHRTTRYDCEGELQWLNVAEQYRGSGMADELMRQMLDWFRSKSIFRVCVNVEPANAAARKVYMRHGATELNEHWLVWKDLSVNEHIS